MTKMKGARQGRRRANDAPRKADDPQGALTLRGLAGRYQAVLWQVVGISALVNLLMLTGPLFMLQVYDRVLTSGSLPTLATLFALTAALFGFYGLFEFLRGRLMTRLGAKLQSRLDARALQCSIDDEGGKGGASAGAPARAVRDVEILQQTLTGPAATALLDLPWSPAYFGIIFIFHHELGLVAIAGGHLLIAIAVTNAMSTAQVQKQARTRTGEAERLEQTVRANRDAVVALGMEARTEKLWATRRREALKTQVQAADRTGAFSAASKTLRMLLQSTILGWAAWLAIDQQITLGMIIAASIMTGRAMAPIDQTIAHWRTYAKTRAAWENLKMLIATDERTTVRTELPPIRGVVEARQVAIGRPTPEGGETILRGLAFHLRPGDALAVIGPTGAGKSALGKALVGLWPTTLGTIRIDGAPLDQRDRTARGAQMGYLPQETSLLEGTIAENIARMDPKASDTDIVKAAVRADAHELILSLPDGYETTVGPGGGGLSGGQRQRVGLARALFAEPALIVLDEPNAHLDAEGERAVTEVVEQLRREKRTVVVMAHRPSVLKACNLFLVLDNGRQRAFGPRDEVLKQTTTGPQLVMGGGQGSA